MTEKPTDPPQPPPPLCQPIRLITCLSALCAILNAPYPGSSHCYNSTSRSWLLAVCKLLEIDPGHLPPSISPITVRSSADDQRDEWSEEDRIHIAGVLVEASLAAHREGKCTKTEAAQIRYTPIARALSYQTLKTLGLEARTLLPQAEKNLSVTLFSALKAAAAEDSTSKDKVESTRAAHSHGWGGVLGRHLATGAGVIAGGVIIGVTGGLAAPAIAALLAPLGMGGLLAGGAAPVVLGTLFGVGGGGLAGKRVRERWKGVEEFGFVEIGAGTRATKEEVEDLREARRRMGVKEEEDRWKASEDESTAEGRVENGQLEGRSTTEDKQEPSSKHEVAEKEASEPMEADEEDNEPSGNGVAPQAATAAVEAQRSDLEQRLLALSLDTGVGVSISEASEPRNSSESTRPSLDNAEEENVSEKKNPPSLMATIVVPGLLTVSKTEAITAWRSICSARTLSAGTHAPGYAPKAKDNDETISSGEIEAGVDGQMQHSSCQEQTQLSEPPNISKTGLKDGRDVYLLRFETERMLKTGRDIDLWVESKLKKKLGVEIIKRTVLGAYFAAVKLPLSVYSMAALGLDNTWMQAQDRAKKAGRILGEVLEKRVQGERPVVLIGSSLGAYTVLEVLLYLASLPIPSGSNRAVPTYVESAYLISLPSAPTPQDWARSRSVVARRLVNAWSDADFVLAGVVRLHEVLSRAVTMSNGMMVGGLGPVGQPGVEDVDVSSVLRGHMELQAKMGEVLRIIDVDA